MKIEFVLENWLHRLYKHFIVVDENMIPQLGDTVRFNSHLSLTVLKREIDYQHRMIIINGNSIITGKLPYGVDGWEEYLLNDGWIKRYV